MPYTTFRGSNLTESKIRDAIKQLKPSQRKKILDEQWEYIPSDVQNDEDKLAFIIASIPNGGTYSAKFLANVLIKGPMWVNPRTAPAAKPNLYQVIKDNEPELIKALADTMRPHKHIPDKYLKNDEWLCIIAIAQIIDWAQLTYPPEKTTLLALCHEWLNTINSTWR